MTESEILLKKIERAFPHGLPPKEEEIALHQCIECDELRKTFVEYDAASLPNHVIDANFDKLVFLSPIAIRAYLGCYLRRSIELGTLWNDVTQFVLYSLSPKHEDWPSYAERFSLLDQEQIKLLKAFIEAMKKFQYADEYGERFELAALFLDSLIPTPRHISTR